MLPPTLVHYIIIIYQSTSLTLPFDELRLTDWQDNHQRDALAVINLKLLLSFFAVVAAIYWLLNNKTFCDILKWTEFIDNRVQWNDDIGG